MKNSYNIASTSTRPKDSGNRSDDLEYSSDSSSDEYYLQERDKKNTFAERFLVASCTAGYTLWESDPIRMADYLKGINEEHGFNICTDMNFIKKGLSVFDRRVERMRYSYRSYDNKASNNESPSTFGACTSNSPGTQTSDNMVMDKEKNAAVNADVQKNNTNVPIVANADVNVDVQKNNTNVPIVANRDIGNGREAGLFVIQRVLNLTDMAESQCRLSMPCNQVKNLDDFLTSEEVDKLVNKSCVPAKVIDSSNRIYVTNLRRVKSGLRNHSYAIGQPWNRIKTDNGFEVGTVVEVRVFRDGDELCFALDRVG